MHMSEYAWWKKKEKKKEELSLAKTATGSCVVEDQAPQQWWSIRSALQPDRWCNSGMCTMLAHSRAVIAYGEGRSKVQGVRACVRVCVCVRACVCVCRGICKWTAVRMATSG